MNITKENRKKAEEFALKFLNSIDPGNKNVDIAKQHFEAMSDNEFADLIERFAKGEASLAYTHPNLNKTKITIDNNIKLCQKLGYNMFDYCMLTDPDIGVTAKTIEPCLITTMYVSRQAQTLEHKNSVPVDDRHLDQMTDQPTGPSKGASVTAPELPVGYAQNWDAVLKEIVNYRGGNNRAYQISKQLAIRLGEISQETIKQFPTSNKIISTISSNFLAGHIDNTLPRK